MSLSKDESSRALQDARRYLRGRVRSTRDVLTYLQRRGVPEPIATRVIAACRGEGLLDDEACARLWAEHWTRHGYASDAIRRKLALKGLDERAIQHATGLLGGTTGDLARARGLAEQSARRIRRPAASSDAASRERARLARSLAARGFDSDVIERVVSERFHFLSTP